MALFEARTAPTRLELRTFGLVLGLVFGLLGVVFRWQLGLEGAARVLWTVGVVGALVYYAVPPVRYPAWLLWMRATRPLGWLLSHAGLALVWYGLFTPLGVAMRAFGRDPLKLRSDRSRKTYWRPHRAYGDADNTSRYFRKF